MTEDVYCDEVLHGRTPVEKVILVDMMAVIKEVAGKVLVEQGGCGVITKIAKYQDSKRWHVVSGETLRRKTA